MHFHCQGGGHPEVNREAAPLFFQDESWMRLREWLEDTDERYQPRGFWLQPPHGPRKRAHLSAVLARRWEPVRVEYPVEIIEGPAAHKGYGLPAHRPQSIQQPTQLCIGHY
jgi:hypothetical protein